MADFQNNEKEHGALLSAFGKNIYHKLVPERYRASPASTINMLKWFLSGLVVRLLFMPFTAHPDLLAIYWRAHDIAYHHRLTEATVNIASHLIHAFFLLVFTPLMPYYEKIWTHPWWWQSPTPDETMWQMFFQFANHQNIFRILFLLKLPYLLFDVASALLILHLFSEAAKGRTAFKFWMLNPLIIFAVYIFGRYEVLAGFFIFVSLYLLLKKRQALGLVILGLSVTVRAFPMLFVLPLTSILGKTVGARVKILVWLLSPLGVLMLVYRFLAGNSGEVTTWLKMPHFAFPLGMNFFLGFHDFLFVFVVGYTLVVLHSFYYARGTFSEVWRYALLILLLLFAVSRFHPQYLSWLTFFLIFAIAEDARFLHLHVVQVVTLVIYTFQWGRPLAGYLLAPLHPGFFAALQSPGEIISQFYPPDTFVGIARSIFTGVSLWMMYLVFANLRAVSSPETGRKNASL